MNTPRRHWIAAPRFRPLLGAAVGAAGAGVYWLGTQLWPTSVAVVLSMLTTALLCARWDAANGARTMHPRLFWFVFAVLLKYNALMALSAASLPFPLPPNLALGLIMIAAQASSRALVVSMQAVSHLDLCVALAIGFAPAALIGMPGLIGLAAAIAARIGFAACLKRKHLSVTAVQLDTAQQMTELCLYLGALAAWAYI